jgi:hypothetical protein
MHIIDRADWETGIAYGWKDTQEAADMAIPVDTLRRQRQKLEDNLYIKCEQKQHDQNIYIYEWRNPRDYVSEVKNPRQGSHETIPSDSEGDNEGLNQGLNQVTSQVKTLPSNPKTKSISYEQEDKVNLLKNSPDWMIAAGVPSEEIARVTSDISAAKKVTDCFEREMGYNPLNWDASGDWKSLKKFLLDKTPEQIKTFALWSKGQYSSLKPVKVRQYPRMAIDCWNLAFEGQDNQRNAFQEFMAKARAEQSKPRDEGIRVHLED